MAVNKPVLSVHFHLIALSSANNVKSVISEHILDLNVCQGFQHYNPAG